MCQWVSKRLNSGIKISQETCIHTGTSPVFPLTVWWCAARVLWWPEGGREWIGSFRSFRKWVCKSGHVVQEKLSKMKWRRGGEAVKGCVIEKKRKDILRKIQVLFIKRSSNFICTQNVTSLLQKRMPGHHLQAHYEWSECVKFQKSHIKTSHSHPTVNGKQTVVAWKNLIILVYHQSTCRSIPRGESSAGTSLTLLLGPRRHQHLKDSSPPHPLPPTPARHGYTQDPAAAPANWKLGRAGISLKTCHGEGRNLSENDITSVCVCVCLCACCL